MMRAMPTTTPDNYKDNDTKSCSEGSNTQFGNIGKPNAKPEPEQYSNNVPLRYERPASNSNNLNHSDGNATGVMKQIGVGGMGEKVPWSGGMTQYALPQTVTVPLVRCERPVSSNDYITILL